MPSVLVQTTPVETNSVVRKRFNVRSMSEAFAVLIELREQKFTGAVSIDIGQGTPSRFSTEEKGN